MKTITSSVALAAACLLLSVSSFSQQNRAFNQNSSRSNHTRGMSIFFSPVYTTPVSKSEDSLLFRGSGAGIKFGGDYFFGNIGLGAVSGFSSSVADDALINTFLKRSSIPQDQLVISKSAQQSMYLLLGPSVRFGNAVQLFAHAKGGLFINNGGLVNIQQKGAVRSIYRNEATTKSIYPGFQAGFGVQYSTKSDTWSFGFGADYMNTKTQVQNYDLRRANGIEGLKLSRTISDLMAGISIRYNIKSPRDAASGQATGKRIREAGSGLPTGRRSTLNNRDAASGLATGRRTPEIVTEEVIITDVVELPEPGAAANCGPVTQRVTNPDGSVREMTFACPDDAAAYQRSIATGMPNRISMNVTVPKQTQGATFGEKVNQGLQGPGGTNAGRQTQGATFGEKVNAGLHAAGGALAQGKNIISGNISWATESSTGIVTNKTKLAGAGGGAAAASYAATGLMVNNPGTGSVLTLYSREAGSGQASGRREKGSGLATGRRQYEPFYKEGLTGSCDTCAVQVKLSSIKNNPLYKENGTSGNNPLHGRAMQGSPDDDCDGLAGLEVYLKEPGTGAVVARTITEACGNFFFANVPDGQYVVAVVGMYASKKGYDYYQSRGADLKGVIETGNTSIQISLDMIPTGTELDPTAAAALIKTKTKSNQSNDRKAAPAGEEEIWSPRSNIRIIPVTTGDLDADGAPDLISGNVSTAKAHSLLGGALPGGAVISAMARPGNPIGGISIKGGKNPGGNIGSRTTNENGEFEFTDLEAGSYTFTVEQKLFLEDEIYISAGSSSRAQDHNSSRSNKTASGIAPDPDNGGGGADGNKAQDHNSSRSNKSSSGIAPDPAGGEKLVASKGDVKITASQNGQSLRTISVVADLDGDGVYETDVTSRVSDELIMDKEGNISSPQQKAGISTSRSNIRDKKALQAVTSTVFTVQGSATVNGKEVPVQAVYKVVEKATSGLKDTLKTQVSIRPAEKYSPAV